eukprot:CAMPEP_0179973334 /NCGR_PEP_ID=MMETSP0983-20121128/37311_1 /TAXON_ID=483367 /ORGANISM="non described non described, Strain CCMP 2436" /LENGTH=147 /DNA_ID=CAMNT_0021889129 /DNA_START=429 /DNA_END=872 /DNA_ORIENTATION=+
MICDIWRYGIHDEKVRSDPDTSLDRLRLGFDVDECSMRRQVRVEPSVLPPREQEERQRHAGQVRRTHAHHQHDPRLASLKIWRHLVAEMNLLEGVCTMTCVCPFLVTLYRSRSPSVVAQPAAKDAVQDAHRFAVELTPVARQGLERR